MTLADIRLFVTLVRFDEVYVVYFKTNKKRIADYPNILNYVRDLYQMPGVADTGTCSVDDSVFATVVCSEKACFAAKPVGICMADACVDVRTPLVRHAHRTTIVLVVDKPAAACVSGT